MLSVELEVLLVNTKVTTIKKLPRIGDSFWQNRCTAKTRAILSVRSCGILE